VATHVVASSRIARRRDYHRADRDRRDVELVIVDRFGAIFAIASLLDRDSLEMTWSYDDLRDQGTS